MSYLNDHKLLEELTKIRRGYDRMRTWIMFMGLAVVACFWLLWAVSGRVRWIERKWDQGYVLIIEKEDADDVRAIQERRR
jgi:hypothetical protein